MRSMRGLLHPVRKIPHDIWRMIFLELQGQTLAGRSSIPSYSMTGRLRGETIREAQTLAATLVLVSKKWRDTAENIPQLWRFIHAHLTSDLTSDRISTATERLQRIRMRYNQGFVPTVLFDVYVRLGPDVARDGRFEDFLIQLNFVCQHSRACELAVSDSIGDFCDSYLSRWFDRDTEYLEILCLTAGSSTMQSPRRLPPLASQYSRTNYKKLFPTCPRLRSVQLGNFPVDLYASATFAREATNLKHVELWRSGDATGDELLTTLKLCPSTPAITWNVHSALELESAPALCHTALRCLKLTIWNAFAVDFAIGLTLPNLERINFDGSETVRLRGFGDAIASFLDRVCPNVSSVTINCYDVESSITRTLRALLRLRSLQILVSILTDDALFEPDSPNALSPFPALEQLIIDDTACARGFTGRPLMEFIRARFKKSTDWQSHTLSSAPHAAVPHLKRVFVALEEDEFSDATNEDLIETWKAEYLDIVGDQDMRPEYSPTDDLDQLEQEFMVYKPWGE
ncbi:hypothetical protein EXIGLDRAFT_315491 [Exidia glandulosa HHB12029]|uniref:F-box domain-containing protein n=1 Tax=Exidia glandulosa HHB12029 TaxID=1314781 RepID=A0A165CY01_EXIGL|nr:hypothetical protein EXIGLDRAFT_315491 [Exidia glandulosa HHB12029]